jgi:hypothetical protein
MTYTFKLSRRLAISNFYLMLTPLFLLCACTETTDPASDLARGGIKGPLVSLMITPKIDTLIPAEKRLFIAKGVHNNGDTVDVSAAWKATGGQITPNGEYQAGLMPGRYQVIGTHNSGTLTDTAEVVVSASESPTLIAIALTPASVSLSAGATQQFTASGKMSDGSPSPVTVSWSATGGTISSAGLYTAGQTAGTFRVIASQSGGTLADTATVTVTAPSTTPPPPSTSACVGTLRTVNVSTVSALNAALSNALPGDCINLAAGTYSLPQTLSVTKGGTAQNPVVIQGVGSASILQQSPTNGIYVRASYIHWKNLRNTGGFFGFYAEGVTGTVFDAVEVDHIQNHAIGLHYGSHHNVVKNSRIHDIGLGDPRYGEGIYVGGYVSQGSSVPDDLADYNQVIDNTFGPNVTAESIDYSEGADNGVVSGNTIDGRGSRYIYGQTNSLISLRGVGHRVDDNVLSHGSPHGIAIYQGSATFHRNRIALFNLWNYPAIGIWRVGGTATVYCDNAVTDIPPGGAAYNVTCIH